MMRNLNNKKLITISFISTILALIIFYFSFASISTINSNVSSARKELKKTKKQIELKKSNIESLDEKLKILKDQKTEAEKLEKELENANYSVDFSNAIAGLDQNKISFINTDLNAMIQAKESEKSGTDILISSLLFLDSYYTNISEKIVENNNRIEKLRGYLSYKDISENSLLKYKFYENMDSNLLLNKLDQENTDFASNLVFLKEGFLNTYLVSLKNSESEIVKSDIFNLNKEDHLFKGKTLSTNQKAYTRLIDSYVFLLDSYAEDYEALDQISFKKSSDKSKDTLNALLMGKDKIVRIEKEDANANYKYFYYGSYGNVLFSIDTDNLNTIYYDKNNMDQDYKQALNLLSNF